MEKNLRFVLPVVLLLVAACGGAVQRNGVQREEAAAQCSISLAQHSNADAIQRALQAVNDGVLDPCSGRLPQRDLYGADLASVTEDRDGYVVLVFWMHLLHPDRPGPQRP